MACKSFLKILPAAVLIVQILVTPIVFDVSEVKAQQDHPRFLITPYYSSEIIKSLFDHHYPTGVNFTDGEFANFSGNRWTSNVSIGTCSCTSLANCKCYDGHNGIDFGLYYEQVLAAADGVVTQAGWNITTCHDCNYGLWIEIQHTYNNQLYRTHYAHLSTVTVQVGQNIKSGTIIGTSGSTGVSTGPHLHFDIYINDNGVYKQIDPFGWNPVPGAYYQNDPWPQVFSGHESWCMWKDGEWANLCDSSRPSRPLPKPMTISTTIIDDNTGNTAGFTKGYGGINNGLINHPCTGNCSGWTRSGDGIGGYSYYTTADRNTNPDNVAKWQPQSLPISSARYEVFVWIPNIPDLSGSNFTWQAKYIVYGADGYNYTTIVDEYVGGGHDPRAKWLSLGIYYLNSNAYVYTTDATGEANNTHCPNGPNHWCYMTADKVKFERLMPAYLPDLNRSLADWNSTIFTRNNGGGFAFGKITYFNNGAWRVSSFPTIISQGLDKRPPCDAPVNTAMLDFDQDISAVVTNRQGMCMNANAYNGVGHVSYNGEFRAGTSLFLPILYRHTGWGYFSKIFIQNTGISTANITVNFYNQNGTLRHPATASIPVDGVKIYDLQNQSPFNGWSDYYGTATISSDYPLAVVVESFNPSINMDMNYNAVINGTSGIYLPYLMKNYSGWNSCVAIQNTSTSVTASFYLKYYQSGGSTIIRGPFNLAAKAAQTICQSDPNNGMSINGRGSGYVYTTQGNVAVVVNQSSSNQVMSYSGITSPAQTVILPYLVKASYDNGAYWNGGIMVQNTGSSPLTITARFYDMFGDPVGTPFVWNNLGGGASDGLYLPSKSDLPNGFLGSAVLTANGNFAALGNASSSSACYGDSSLTYNGVNR